MAQVVEAGGKRTYLAPTEEQEAVAKSARPTNPPMSELPTEALGFRVQAYGMLRHADLFTRRQLVALEVLTEFVRSVGEDVVRVGGSVERANAITTYLALAMSKSADYSCALAPWYSKEDRPTRLFNRQAIPMVWDFAEINPLGEIGGTFLASVRIVSDAIQGVRCEDVPRGEARQLDATTASVLPVASAVVCTDPPYYDNIGYADLSDFFYVWLRPCLREIYPDLFSTLLTPKAAELVADPSRVDGDRREADRRFEAAFEKAFKEIGRVARPDVPVTVFYAFKQAEEDESTGVASTGWETMLEGLISAGLGVTGTWPMRTERGGRLRDQASNALASSIVLVCRRRTDDAPMATRKELIAALKAELPFAVAALQEGSIAPVDLAQASIGPGMGVFSRYSRVVEADGTRMSVRSALGLINQVLDETLAEQESDFDGDTRWALAWFEESGMSAGPFGKAETLSKAKNTSIAGLVQAGLLESKAGKVRLLARTELSDSWLPSTDTRLTVWEIAQHLIRALETSGEAKASEVLRLVGGLGEAARELAYRLYVICERKKWSAEALAYNSLVVAWPEVARLASSAATSPPAQERLL
jgi:putative DNA methylase